MGRGGAPTREISFVSLVAYGPKVFLLSLRNGGLQLLKPGREVPNTHCTLRGEILFLKKVWTYNSEINSPVL